MAALVPLDSTPKCDSVHRVSAAAGTLPVANRRVTRQSIALLNP